MTTDTQAPIILGTLPHQIIFNPLLNFDDKPQDTISVEITARAGNFYGNCKTQFTVFMLRQFQKAFKNFSENASGEFTLYSESREFWASITGDGTGQFTAHCTLNDCDHEYTRLRFDVKFSGLEFPAMINAIQKILNIKDSFDSGE